MPEHASSYHEPGGRRAIAEEIAAYITERTGCTSVPGFSEFVDTGDALGGGERLAGYLELYGEREWVLPLNARKGMAWKTASVPAGNCDKVLFLLSVGFGNGSPLPQPSGRWDIYCNDRFAVSVRVVNHSQLWRNEHCSFAFSAHRLEAAEPYGSLCLSSVIKDESFAAFGPAFLVVPAEWVPAGRPAVIRVEACTNPHSTRWFQLLTTTCELLHRIDVYRVVELLTTNGVRKSGDYNLYFGDIHTHSGQVRDENKNEGCGTGSREDNYAYARGPGGVDFYSLTDHEWQIDPQKIGEYFALADEHNEDGRFVCLPGYEYTSLLYGHRNAYFRDASGTVFNSIQPWGHLTMDPSKAATPQQMWAALEATGSDFITVPHHPNAIPHPCSWDFYNPKYDRLVEVYSNWGSSEYYGDFPRGVSDRFRVLTVRDALKRGMRMGIIASADAHDGHPGNSQSSFHRHHAMFHPLGSGRAVVLAHELTRDAVFDALHARRCYATTGTPIVLSFSIDGHVMGSELPMPAKGKRPVLKVACEGTNGIDHIRIMKNASVVHTVQCHGEFTTELEWEDAAWTGAEPAFYYVRVVQNDRESAWSSPIWIG